MHNEINDMEPRAPLPILERLELKRLAILTTIVEAAAVAGAVAEHEPGYIALGTFVGAVIVGGSVYDAHEHHVNGYTRKSGFVKERSWPTRMG